MAKKGKKKRGKLVVPKLKCCESRKKCRRCPTRMLKEGTLPDGLRVRHRRLVDAETPLVPLKKKQVRLLILAAGTAANSTQATTSTKGSKGGSSAPTKAGKRAGRKAA